MRQRIFRIFLVVNAIFLLSLLLPPLLPSTAASAAPSPATVKYKVVAFDTEARGDAQTVLFQRILDRESAAGWQLVEFSPLTGHFIFKR